MLNWKTPALTFAIAASLAPFSAAHAQRCRSCVAEDTTHRTHLSPALGLRVGAPQKVSAAAGIVVGEEWQTNGRDHSRNVSLFAEPGMSGGRASLAYFDHGYGNFGSGFGIAASALRTWNDPWWAKENVTYVGGELIIWPIVFAGPRIGVFRAVGTTGAGLAKRWLVTFDFGFGL